MFVRNWDEKLLSDLAILMVFVRLLLYSTIGNVIDQQDSVYTKHVCLSLLVMIVVVLPTLVESSDCKSLDICEKYKCFSPSVCIHLSPCVVCVQVIGYAAQKTVCQVLGCTYDTATSTPR